MQHDAAGDADLTQPLEAILATSQTVACARFARDGSLIGANPRLLELVDARDAAILRLPDLVVEGQRAEMERLLAGVELPQEPSRVHLAKGDRAPTTLLVTWARDGDALLLVGEVPLADLEASQAVLTKLNSRVSELARENAKKSAQLARALDELRQAQTMLVHREKMAALGQMTAGVAHELNNPLAYVRNNQYLLGQGLDELLGLINLFGEGLDAVEASRPDLFETLMRRIEDIDLPRLGERLPELQASIDEGLERAIGLIQGLRTFSRLDEAAVKTVDLNESLRSVVDFARFLMKESDTVFVADYGELPPVTCSPGQLNQAVMNVLTNAIQAAGPGGKVGLITATAGEDVLITIVDDGPGVPDELAAHIFDPFFTTREVGEGTGLGLSIAHTVMEAHGGGIEVAEAAGGGAAFVLRLPLQGRGEA